MSAKRLLPLSGIVFVALVVLAVPVLSGSSPDSGGSARTVMSYYDAHNARATVAAFVLAAAAPFLALFGLSLVRALSPGEGQRYSFWQLGLIAAGVGAAMSFAVAALLHFALADAASHDFSAGVLQTLNVLDSDAWVLVNSGLGLMMLAAAGSLLPFARTYRPLGWAALVLGVLLFIPFADFFALVLTGLWIIATSVFLFRNGAEGTHALTAGIAASALSQKGSV